MGSLPKIGVLLINLGTPDAPTTRAVKQYLSQFLRDKRVVDIPSRYWYPILYGIVLRRRSPRIAALYQSIWTEEGAPLLVHSRRIMMSLQTECPHLTIRLAMTYGNPSVSYALKQLKYVDKLIVLPLFPQYSSATTAAAWDALQKHFINQRHLPSIAFVRDYASHPDYIFALADSISKMIHVNGKPDLLLFSYHGIPQRYIEEGDDYQQRCELTTKLVTDELEDLPYQISYQSRFGKEPWLQPYTSEVIQQLPKKGIKRLYVICPGFACDCLETLEEIAIRERNNFIGAGGEEFDYIPALNSEIMQIQLLLKILKHYTR